MAQSSWPFENIDTTETQYSQLFRTLNNGVNGTPDGGELEVGPGSAGLTVDVAAGQAMVRGHFYVSTEVETRSLAVADPTNGRIDLVVLRLDPIANSIVLAVKTGVPDPAPVAPTLVQTDGGVFEQPLANVLVPANAGVPSTITDRREFMGTKLGTWTTDGRPVPAGRVLFGFNTTLEAVEFYDPINEVWGPVAPEINSLDDIGDVTITTPADGEALIYDSATSEWVNGQVDTAGIADDAVTTQKLGSDVALGKVLQVVETQKTTSFSSFSGSTFVDVTGLSVTITPANVNNKILIFVNGLRLYSATVDGTVNLRVMLSGSQVGQTVEFQTTGAANRLGNSALTVLHSPSTTSAITYQVQVNSNIGTAATVERSSITAIEVAD